MLADASSFIDRLTAARAVRTALEARPEYVQRITEGGRMKTVFRYDVGEDLGSIVSRDGAHVSSSVVEVVLRADPGSPLGFRVQSAYPVRDLR